MRRIMLTISTALVLAIFAAPAGAFQDGEKTPTSKKSIAPTSKERTKATGDAGTTAAKPAARPTAKDPAAAKGNAAAKGKPQAKGKPAGRGAPADMGTAASGRKQIMLEEAKYRQRMAKIRRLRQLAQKQGNTERLKALDGLEAKLNASHERKLAMWKKRLGDEDFDRVEKRLKQGRGARGKGKGKAGGAARPTSRDPGSRDISGGGAAKPTGKTRPAATDEDAAAQKRKQMEAERRRRSREMEKGKSKEDAAPKSKGDPR